MKPLSLAAGLLAALLIVGCAHPAPRAIYLPTTAAVRAPIVAARTSNARAVQLAAKAVHRGIAAGSADARALSLATAATGSDLARTLAQVDQLTAQLLNAQDHVDAVEKNLVIQLAGRKSAELELAATSATLRTSKSECRRLRWDLVRLSLSGLLIISLIGRQLEELLRKVEAAAFHEAAAVGHGIEGVALRIPAVLKIVARFSWLLAFV